jgi:hypothetical protein
LRIGGGTLAATTLLHLYAPSSNGIVDFVSNVTLNSTGSAPVIAANTVIVENGVVVTIGGTTPANVFTNVPNYSSRNGGNNSTTGTFAGAGATTQPLSQAPPFDPPTAVRTAQRAPNSVSNRGGGKAAAIHRPAIAITDSSQLHDLLDNATATANGKAIVSSGSNGHKNRQTPTAAAPDRGLVHRPEKREPMSVGVLSTNSARQVRSFN